ncbi:replicative DNA helicase Mcm [Methanococcus maripaludis]|uniref:Replicative DNA helicase Mcm n=1 Tax=Methanococcus maripaludis TaxID=39152 RepID=A0A7J9P686_METMI|nr:minichromosome maintenance protein MCM [Methanococcus maripaludis]MBA2858320.1 replicative DNA helicase Mcm [Methanococcus maripaludis]
MDDKRIQNIRPFGINYMKTAHMEDIRLERQQIAVDVKDLYDQGGFEIVEFIEEFPKEGIELLEECYNDAYFDYKIDKISSTVSIHNLPDTINKKGNRSLAIEDINCSTHGKLMEVEGVTVLATKIKMAMKKATYICTQCGEKKVQNIENPFEMNFEPICPKCAQSMALIEDESEYTDFQELKLQQPLELMSNPEDPPKYISVLLENTPGIYNGRVKVTGIPVKTQKNKKIPLYDLVYKGIHCKTVDEKLESDFTDEEIKTFREISENPDIVEILSELLFPEIKGHSSVKKAIFLQQIKGVKKGNCRADSHIIIITDPGVGKSKMLRKLALIPGNAYASANMSTGVGLTAAVVQESTEIGENTYVVKPGLLIRANKGTACIDEFTTMKKMDSLLEAMESQTIHINKGGINTKLPAECAVLSACNPRWGRFDENVPVMDQITIPAPVLSRFDLIFTIKDTPDRERDREIAHHIVKVHRAYLGVGKTEDLTFSSRKISGIDVDFQFICKYIAYARTKAPVVSDEAEELLTDYYLDMRKGAPQITARQFEAALRIAEQFAKARLKGTVETKDADDAIKLMSDSLKEVAYDKETGQYDIDRIMGLSKKDRIPMMAVYEILKDLLEESVSELIDVGDIVEKAKEKNISEEQVSASLRKLIINGDIDEPKVGKYRVI